MPYEKKTNVAFLESTGGRDPRKETCRGYYMSGMSPAICPICRKVIPTITATRHLQACLRGRDFRIYHGIIRVFD